MIKSELLKKIEAIIDGAEREHSFGTVEIEIKNGQVVLLRTIKTEKIESRGEDRHANQNRS